VKELTETSDRATDDELRKAIGRRLNDFANHPEGKTKDECAPTSKQVTNEDCRDGRDDTAQMPCSDRKTY